MKKITVLLLALFAADLLAVSVADAAIRRVPARYNLLTFYGGYASPHGEYDEIGPISIVSDGIGTELDADELFDGTYFLGFDYGTFFSRHHLVSIGFRFTDHNVQDWIFAQVDEFNYRQYDLDFNWNVYPFDLTQSVASPFVGVGVQAGLTSFEPAGNFDSESEITFGLGANFGADLKLFDSPDGRSFMTLASVNSYTLLGSDDRPKYLNVGGALRYWFR